MLCLMSDVRFSLNSGHQPTRYKMSAKCQQRTSIKIGSFLPESRFSCRKLSCAITTTLNCIAEESLKKNDFSFVESYH